MAKFNSHSQAFGSPGAEPRWQQGNKDGVGTANSLSNRTWFTISRGILNEIYYPTADRPQIRDVQYLITDGSSFFNEEQEHLFTEIQQIAPDVLGYCITNSDPEGRYTITKEIITDPNFPCILQQTRLTTNNNKLRLYAFCSPHMGVGGWNDSAFVVEVAGQKILIAQEGENWLAMAATVFFSRVSCGYVNQSDGWTDLADNFQMDWEFERAEAGNIALMGELPPNCQEFKLGFAFGNCLHDAVTTLLLSLDTPFAVQRSQYIDGWKHGCADRLPLEKFSQDDGNLYNTSFCVLMAHEDKIYPGALIASLSIPWGEAHSDSQRGGYHLVWPRDMVNSVTGLMAAGHNGTAQEALIYLAASQNQDGGFAQNFWINGKPHWTKVQLDQVSFSILLAWQLYKQNALRQFDAYAMTISATKYIIKNGPATQQERWEEISGYSPSTLASNIAALICTAAFARERGDEKTAQFIEEYADFLESHVEAWTVTTEGTLLLGIKKHYIRINPANIYDPHPNENPNQGMLTIPNSPPGSQRQFRAKEIVDAGFLALVRYGIRKPDDPIIVDSVKVVDEVLKVETPSGACWHRYNHDGYGQRQDGGAFLSWGKGRAWPLLTGERGHYELAAGHDVQPFIRALENFASKTGLLPEQVWDEPDYPELSLFLGRPTGSAMPLAWAHAEYIKLLRSVRDGKVFDLIPEVAERYLGIRKQTNCLEIWKFNRQIRTIQQGYTLRILALASFCLRWTCDGWQTVKDTNSTTTALEIAFVDIAISHDQKLPICFTFYWTEAKHWENRNYEISVVSC